MQAQPSCCLTLAQLCNFSSWQQHIPDIHEWQMQSDGTSFSATGQATKELEKEWVSRKVGRGGLLDDRRGLVGQRRGGGAEKRGGGVEGKKQHLNLLLQLQALLPEPLRSLPALTVKFTCLQLQVSQLLLQQGLLVGVVLLILTPVCTGLTTHTRSQLCSQQ